MRSYRTVHCPYGARHVSKPTVALWVLSDGATTSSELGGRMLNVWSRGAGGGA